MSKVTYSKGYTKLKRMLLSTHTLKYKEETNFTNTNSVQIAIGI